MKTIACVGVLLFTLMAGCGENAKAGETGVKEMMNQVGDAAKQAGALDDLKGTFESLKSTLGGITDGATAEKAKGSIEQIAGKLKDQMGALGKLGALTGDLSGMKDTLVKGAMEQVGKLLGNADIQKVIGPALEKLKAALSG